TNIVLKGYVDGLPYEKLVLQDDFGKRFIQLRYVKDESLHVDPSSDIIFMTKEYLKDLNNKVDEITKQFKKRI
ncbi:hypothetical protein, partial [Acinetobacter oleivorans]|uniref:hypothetical protein n=1 Tax=Acinetobacter oleivorans TaxID=1148157 RepID=UPI00157FD7F1